MKPLDLATWDRSDPRRALPALAVVLFCAVVLSAVVVSVHDYFALAYAVSLLIFGYVIIRARWDFFVVLFLVFFPLGPILPYQALLIPGLDIKEVVSLALLLGYFLKYRSLDLDVGRTQKLAILLCFLYLVLYANTLELKLYFIYGNPELGTGKLLLRIVKNLVYFMCLLVIISKANDPQTRASIKRGLVIGLLVMGGSVLLTPLLEALGLYVRFGAAGEGLVRSRAGGLLEQTQNFLVHNMALGFGYFIALMERKVNPYLIGGLGVILSAALVSASRGGFIAICLILFAYLLRSLHRKSLSFVLIILLCLLVFIVYGDYLLERFEQTVSLAKSGDYLGIDRLTFLPSYWREFRESPYFFFTGIMKKSILGYWKAPHNQYIETLYIGGVALFSFFMILFYRIYLVVRDQRRSGSSLNLLYPFIGFYVPAFFYPCWLIVYFPLILAVWWYRTDDPTLKTEGNGGRGLSGPGYRVTGD